MQLYHVISLVAVIAQASAASSSASHSDLNGWYPCSESTFADEGGSGNQDAECAVYSAPLCYPGICATPKPIDSTVDIFVKRVAAVIDAETATNVWLLQGGPGASSTAMESAMVELHARLDGAVNVYTMDHRGTGRSTLLDCVAAQATTTGSPWGSGIDTAEVPACAQALEKKYGNLSSFSMTSAAMDMATFISDYSNSADTIVYAVSYGTALVERLIHLDPPEVTGYVLDGVATSSGTSKEFEYFSTWDADFGDVGDAFLALCATQSECGGQFVSNSLPVTLQNVITQFDNDAKSTCAALLSDVGSEPASYILRRVLGSLLQSTKLRTLIPPIVYRLNRCASNDVEILTHFFTNLNKYLSWPSEDDAFESTLLYYLIVFSEMWETPEPSIVEMISRFTNTRVSNGGTYTDIPLYCAFSKESSPVCDQLDVGTYDANGIIYERDQYWNKSAAIPAQASVLLLSGKLDPQTPHKYAQYLLEALDGSKKELVTFNYATHGTLWTTPMDEDDDESETCGMRLLLSYVSSNGDLNGLDKSCLEELPAFSMTPPLVYQYYFLSTNDIYDGDYDESLAALVTGSSSSIAGFVTTVSKENATYKAAFIVFLVLFVATLALAGLFAFRWLKLKRENERNRATGDLPDDIEISTPPEVEATSPELTTAFSTQRSKEAR
ncbi:hypothetical protein PC129_g12738 [Phytophthora cactorum]|uniref:Peptidase S33 tripeptidyl aminopeptidase-like C-terminal domain-containing protein n=1 Tax=Phytophthora cactorum TaxID=29920 RepID=A0A8T1CS55_9STRA|nr:hypothetical protein Pcac1_g23828 [Phytophthora cactorum]KAG2839108.1 hypothetical protein PC111_g3997 [Phytophthora cactorum]KAG2848448.1 hypothetical protein PC112_g694 [Phytophthora cactorum]KAG2868683.1 hypothetical protein PC113_g881 [Phytophthora cactorum]KAG2894821.1 hypothetical protein PC114_g15724 [Phytophthora cactorum]